MESEDRSPAPQLRASDADRDQAASVLNEALAQGRLTPQEHSDRLDLIYAAKTHAEIVPVIADLPASSQHTALAPRPGGELATADRTRPIIAIFGGAVRKGVWRVPRTSVIVTVFGGADIDLREAILPGRDITIRAVAVFGGMNVTVPPEMHVVDSGVAVFGGRDISGDSAAGPDSPTLHLTGACVFGGVAVQHKRRKSKR
jgi:hypothetical protein